MYIHTDLFAAQSPKKPGDPCGDAYGILRDDTATYIILADGLGSGIKAHIAATMCVARIKGLISHGMSAREAFHQLAATMDKVWGSNEPFAVFTIARILMTGQTSVFGYEMPPPLLITRSYAQVVGVRTSVQGKAIIHESSFNVGLNEGLLLISDGISQAGIGKHFINGWEAEGVRKFIQTRLPCERIEGQTIADEVHGQAKAYWPPAKGDDCTVLCAVNRRGIIVNLLSGPPMDKKSDEQTVHDFAQSDGIHVISGGSTAKMAARILNRYMEVEVNESVITPPAYRIDGFELATEGVITLNQVFHLLDEEPELYPKGSPASELAYLLKMADRINIWHGLADNRDDGNIEFRQQGLLPRKKILVKIIEKLLFQNKLVITHET